MAGTVIVIWLMGVTVVEGCINGLPAIANGEFAPGGFSSIGKRTFSSRDSIQYCQIYDLLMFWVGFAGLVSQAVSVFGFAFYIQPVIMPLLGEMPEGALGVKLTSYSTRVVVLGNVFLLLS